jgi:SAM-dependent methyltransferase
MIIAREGTVPGVAADEFWEFERAGWDRAAGAYEECWTDTSLFIAPLLDAAGVSAGTRLLDIACGPGFVSEAAVARGAVPTGVDVSESMLERARLRVPDVEFVLGDAQALSFGDAAFDAVTLNFGLQHVSKPDLALREARRVLVDGGRLAFTVWVAEGHVADEILEAALAAHALPVSVPEGPDPYRFADAGESRRALEAAGFAAVAVETVTAPWRTPTADLLFEAHMHAGLREGTVLRAQPPERLEAIRAAIVDGVSRYAEGDEFVMPIVARVVSARAG